MPAKDREHTPAAIPSTRPATFVPDPESREQGKMKQVGPMKVDVTGYGDGSFHKIGEPEEAEAYSLKIVKDDPHGQTHQAINQEHFWSGTAEQFKEQFEKE
jgi:hypothetical protein